MKRSTYVHSSNKYNAQTSLAIYCHWWLTILTLIVSKVSIISFTRTSLQNYYSSIVGNCSAAATGQQWRPLLPFCWYFNNLVYFPSDLFLDWPRSIFESFSVMYVFFILTQKFWVKVYNREQTSMWKMNDNIIKTYHSSKDHH